MSTERSDPHKFYIDTYDEYSRNNCIKLSLAFTQGHYAGLDDLADRIFKLLAMGYSVDHLDVWVTFNAITLDVGDAESGVFKIRESGFLKKGFDAKKPKENLIDALKHLVDEYWKFEK